jgi:hypothetical protein
MLAALATMRQGLMPIDGAYSSNQVLSRMTTISVMRDHVLKNNGKAFTHYAQEKLRGQHGDMMCDLLETLYEHLGMASPETATWEEFEDQFIKQND